LNSRKGDEYEIEGFGRGLFGPTYMTYSWYCHYKSL